jgi:hypothetical protein
MFLGEGQSVTTKGVPLEEVLALLPNIKRGFQGKTL